MIPLEKARELSQPAMLGSTPFYNLGRVTTLRDLIVPYLDENNLIVNHPDARVQWDWNNRVMAVPVTYVVQGPVSPFNLTEHYGPEPPDPNGKITEDDFCAATDLAIRYAVLNDVAAGSAAIRILTAWKDVASVNTNAGSALNWSNHWPMMLQAAMLVRSHSGYTTGLNNDLISLTNRGTGPVNALGGVSPNNFGAWANCYEMAAAVFSQDRARLNRAIRRWRTLFDYAVEKNVPVHEVYRQGSGNGDGSYGLWYSNFFLYGMTIAAEWSRFAGEWLYDHRSEDGSTFKDTALLIRWWTRYPEHFPYNTSGTPSSTVRILAHDDILHALWPSAESQWLLDRFATGSIRDVFGMRGAVHAYRYRPLYG